MKSSNAFSSRSSAAKTFANIGRSSQLGNDLNVVIPATSPHASLQ
jgi:hypothetical protein